MISVIAPTYNRFEMIEDTIRQTLSIPTNIDFELLVINDGDSLPFSISHPKLSILKNPKRGVASARNFGAAHAKYPILFFIDDDMRITADSFKVITELHAGGFFSDGCAVLNWNYPDTLIQEMENNKIGRYLLNAKFHTLEGRLNQRIDKSATLQKITIIGSGSLVISAKTFFSVDGYNEAFIFAGEDEDLSLRLQNAKIDRCLYTGITCYHHQNDRLDIEHFLDREFRGYLSLFSTRPATLQPDKRKQLIYTALIPFRFLFIILFRLSPNFSGFDFISFRTIGILSSITYFRAWYKAGKKKQTL